MKKFSFLILAMTFLLFSAEKVDQLAQFMEQEMTTMSEITPYDTLPISVEDKEKISKILLTMSENSIFKLLFEKKRLERLGQEVNHVHPIRFLGTVFTDPRLIHALHRIRRSGFKWDGFMDGFSERLMQEVKAKNVNQYIPGLAQTLRVRAEDIQAYINYRDFEGLVLFLLERHF